MLLSLVAKFNPSPLQNGVEVGRASEAQASRRRPSGAKRRLNLYQGHLTESANRLRMTRDTKGQGREVGKEKEPRHWRVSGSVIDVTSFGEHVNACECKSIVIGKQ